MYFLVFYYTQTYFHIYIKQSFRILLPYSRQILLAILEFWDGIGLSDKATLFVSGSFSDGLAIYNSDYNLSSDLDVWVGVREDTGLSSSS